MILTRLFKNKTKVCLSCTQEDLKKIYTSYFHTLTGSKIDFIFFLKRIWNIWKITFNYEALQKTAQTLQYHLSFSPLKTVNSLFSLWGDGVDLFNISSLTWKKKSSENWDVRWGFMNIYWYLKKDLNLNQIKHEKIR